MQLRLINVQVTSPKMQSGEETIKLKLVMTTKIIIAALTAKFGADAQAIAELCNRAPNPSFEIEALLGVYEMPNLPKQVTGRDGVYTLTSFNPAAEPSRAVCYSKTETLTRFFRDEAHFEGRSKNYTGAGDSRRSDSQPLEKTFVCVNTNTTSLEWWLEQTPQVDDNPLG
jgi:hypothetical protein